MSFDTPLSLCGPLRRPRQMLAEQEYGGHTSIHDDAMAEKLGSRAGPIEGPTHFSQFVPLLAHVWGKAKGLRRRARREVTGGSLTCARGRSHNVFPAPYSWCIG